MNDRFDDFQNTGDGLPPDFGRNEDFVQQVLGSTSGSPCSRAEAQLPDLIAGGLAEFDRQLVQAHLEHCEPCRQLAVVLTWATPLLPDMAEVQPPPGFTAGVLARTSLEPQAVRRRRLQAAAERAPDEIVPFGDRLREWWERQIMRPGFAVELAYAATLVLVLLTAIPGAPLRGTPDRALQMVNAGVGTLPLVDRAVTSGLQWVVDVAGQGVDAGWSRVETRLEPVVSDWNDRVAETAHSRAEISVRAQQAVDQLQDGRMQEAGLTGKALFDSLREFWHLWWSDDRVDEGEKHE